MKLKLHRQLLNHSRSQDFLWGALFSSKSWWPFLRVILNTKAKLKVKVNVDLYSASSWTHLSHHSHPPNFPAQQKFPQKDFLLCLWVHLQPYNSPL